MRTAVLATGANGSCIAADLTRAGHDVTLIDQWPEHVEAMRTKGLRIEMPEETLEVAVNAHHVCDVSAMHGVFDVVLLCSKAYDARWFSELIKPRLAENGLLVGAQNGMTVDDITAVVGPSRTIGCVVELSSELFTPGIVKRNTPPSRTWFGLGSLDPSTQGREAEVETLLRDVGRVSITPDVLSAKWMKLVTNTMCIGPAAMTGKTIYEAVNTPGARELMVRIGAEALTVGQSLGYRIEPIFGLSREEMTGTNQLLENLLDKVTRDIGTSARDCVLQDHLKGRYSEVDSINGLVVAHSERLGRPAPANAVIVEITRRIRAGELPLDPSNVDLANTMVG
jgi:2-dehydropantoate 2-reductase